MQIISRNWGNDFGARFILARMANDCTVKSVGGAIRRIASTYEHKPEAAIQGPGPRAACKYYSQTVRNIKHLCGDSAGQRVCVQKCTGSA